MTAAESYRAVQITPTLTVYPMRIGDWTATAFREGTALHVVRGYGDALEAIAAVLHESRRLLSPAEREAIEAWRAQGVVT